MEPPPPPIFRAPRPQWMTADIIHLIDTFAALRCCPDHNRNLACTLMWDVCKSLSTDASRWAEMAAEEIGRCLDKP